MIDFIKNLSMLEAFAITIAILFVGRIIYREIFVLRMYFKLVKKQKERMEELKKNKCTGPHSWIDIEVQGETTHVCKECYYSPKHEGFVNETLINAHLQELEYRKEMQEYVDKRLEDIAAAHNIENPKAVYDAMINIKKDFGLQWLDKKLAEMIKEDNA